MLDAVVIGSGPNGLVAAIELAKAGLSVRVLEQNSEPGGAVRSRELTRPGFIHDLGAGFFSFGSASPAMVALDLPAVGVEWTHARLESAHPALDGTCASLARDVDVAAATFALAEDAHAWRQLAAWIDDVRDPLLAMLLGPLPPILPALRFGPINLLKLSEVALSSAGGFASEKFRSEAARRIIPGLGLHTDIGPSDPCGAAVGFMLAALAASNGFAVPKGGARTVTDALLQRLAEHDGEITTGIEVERIITRGGAAVGVVAGGEEIEARAVIADVAAPTLYLRLLDEGVVSPRVLKGMRGFARGFATFKVDHALDGPVPWSHPQCREAAVVHAGDSLDDLERFTRQVRRGELPDHPYLVVGQQSLSDPSRAPAGCHTLYTYTRVPQGLRDWARRGEAFADRIDDRIEALAPGFKQRILARHVTTPLDLEATNPNLLGGDLGGGSAQIQHQLFFRPVFPHFRYRTPVKYLYLGSSYTHPGAGVHGACGKNAATMCLQDLR